MKGCLATHCRAAHDAGADSAYFVHRRRRQGQEAVRLCRQRSDACHHVLPHFQSQGRGAAAVSVADGTDAALQGANVTSVVQKAFTIAQELRTDPFAIKRRMAATPEIVTPTFKKAEIKRERLTANLILGFGQARATSTFRGLSAAVWQGLCGGLQAGQGPAPAGGRQADAREGVEYRPRGVPGGGRADAAARPPHGRQGLCKSRRAAEVTCAGGGRVLLAQALAAGGGVHVIQGPGLLAAAVHEIRHQAADSRAAFLCRADQRGDDVHR